MEFKDLLKKRWAVLLLIAILIFGFYLRAYHLDYPVVGYHNWKETHYLTEARNYAQDGFFSHGFFTPRWDFPSIAQDPQGVHSDTIPTSSIIVGFFFLLGGTELWIARLIHVLFSLGSIVFFYLILKKMYQREDIALVASAIFALTPLAVFFGRQVQLIGPALFFVLMGVYFYLKWIETFSVKDTLLFSIPLLLGIGTKFTFALILVPMIAIFPFKKISLNFLKQNRKIVSFLGGIGIFFIVLIYYFSSLSKNLASQVSSISAIAIFDDNFWTIIKSFFADNYTLLGVWLFIFGVALFFMVKDSSKNKVATRFFASYLIIAVIWFIALSQKLKGHNYHQYPLLPLFVFFVAFLFVVVSNTAVSFFKVPRKNMVTLIVSFCLVGLILFSPSVESSDRMFNTQFYGLDVAGDFLSLQEGNVLHSSHQSIGMLWHSNMKGVKGIPDSKEGFEQAENDRGTNWLFVYEWDFPKLFQNNEVKLHVESNYRLRQVGIQPIGSGVKPVYFIFELGGTSNLEKIQTVVNNYPIKQKEYESTTGTIPFFSVTIP